MKAVGQGRDWHGGARRLSSKAAAAPGHGPRGEGLHAEPEDEGLLAHHGPRVSGGTC